MRHGKLSAAARTGVLCLLGVAISIGWSSAATLTGMTVTAQGDVTRVKVMLDQPVEWSQFALTDPPRLYVDCRDVDSVLPKTLPAATGRVSKVEASVWKGDGYHALTRITLDLSGGTGTDVKAIDGGLLITLGPAGTKDWATATGTAEAGTSTDSMETAAAGTETQPATGTMTGTEEMTPAEAAGMTQASTGDTTAETAPETAPAAAPTRTEPATAGSEPATAGSEPATAGSEPATAGSETATAASQTATPGTETMAEAAPDSATETAAAPETSQTMAETTPETPETAGATPSAAAPTTGASTMTGGTEPPATPQASTASGTETAVAPSAAAETPATATGTPAATETSNTTTTSTTNETPAATTTSTTNETPAATQTPAPAPTKSTPAASGTTTEDTASSELTPAEESLDYSLPDAKTRPETYAGHREPDVADFPLSKPEGLAGRGGARVSLDIQGADIYTVLRSISEYSGVNIVMGYDVRQKVKDPVSFHLENVPWGEALEMVLRSAHLWYRDEGNVVRVDTEENLRNEELARSNAARQLEDVMPLTTRIVEVIYAHAGELKPTVEKSLSRRGVVTVDERTNSLVLTDIRSRVDAAADMIRHLDSQTPQVEIVAKLVDVDAKATRELGVLWSGNNTGSNGDISIDGGASRPDATLGSNTVADPTVNVRFGLVKSWGSVNATISALEKENKANIISNPRITTVNNREARILVGQKIPLIILDEAGNPITQLTTIGIALRVTPHINDQNRITLDLHPEVSDLASQATVQGGVIINTSEADTRVMVENGQTAVIGGLIRANDTKLVTGVPILKDVPLIGAFFSDTSKIREKRELLIFVTPRIITSFADQGTK